MTIGGNQLERSLFEFVCTAHSRLECSGCRKNGSTLFARRQNPTKASIHDYATFVQTFFYLYTVFASGVMVMLSAYLYNFFLS